MSDDMNKPNGAGDPIAQAIQAVEDGPPTVLLPFQVTIASTGRPFQIAVPQDMTEAELVEMTGWILTGLAQHMRDLRAQAKPASRLAIARVMPQ